MFEVGKKYQYTDHRIYTCVGIGKNYTFLEDESGKPALADKTNAYFKEYVPPKPLTFADLKLGEKFRWKGDGVEMMKCIESKSAKYGFVCLETGVFWLKNSFDSFVERVA